MFSRILRITDLFIYLLLCVLLLTGSNTISNEPVERARAYTRPVEFDYFNWSVEALFLKLQSGAVGLPDYLNRESRKQVVMQYLYITERVLQGEDQLNRLYADPTVTDKEAASVHLRAEMDTLYQRQKQLAPLAESILQNRSVQY